MTSASETDKKAKIRELKLLGDSSTTTDYLGFDDYTLILLEGIKNFEENVPLTIGIHGKWGCGKTSLMQMLKTKIDEENKNSIGKTIWFNAWAYGKDEHIGLALLQTILLEIQKDINFKRTAGEILEKTGKLGIDLLLRNCIGLSRVELSQVVEERIEIKNTLRDDFVQLIKQYSGKNGKAIIFVDDLDRCLPDKTIEIFETIKIFLDIPRCIFVIGVEKELIEKGIEICYANNRQLSGKEYIEKLIQVPFNIPKIEENAMSSYLGKLSLEDYEREYLDIILQTTNSNPRKAKIFINSLRILVRIAEDKIEYFDPRVLAKLFALRQYSEEFYRKLEEGVSLNMHQEFLNAIKSRMKGTDALNIEINPERNINSPDESDIKKFGNDKDLAKLLAIEPQLSACQNIREYFYLCNIQNNEEVVEISPEKDLLSKDPFQIKKGLKKIGERMALELLNEKLASKSHEELTGALIALGQLKAYDSAGRIDELLNHKDPDVRRFSARALSQIGSEEYIEDIAKLLEDRNPRVRNEAILALEQLNAKGHSSQVAELLKDHDPDIRRDAAITLGKMRAKDHAEEVVELLKDLEPDVRRGAIQSLEWMDAKEHLERISELLSDKEAMVRRGALVAIGQMRAKKYANKVAKLLEDWDSGVRSDASVALGKLSSIEYAKDIARLLKDKSPSARWGALTALSLMKAKEYRKDIDNLLKDPNEEIRLESKRALEIMDI